MNESFLDCLNKAKPAESIVLEVLSHCTKDYSFHDISDIKQLRHNGDIAARNTKDDTPFFIDVKDDSRIHDKRNILCEEEVYYEETGRWEKGFMYSGYDCLAILSKPEKKIYMVDFDGLKQHYKKGRYIPSMKKNDYQESRVYLLPLFVARKYGFLLYEIDYVEVGFLDKPIYLPSSVKKVA